MVSLMSKHSVVIYNIPILFDIFSELKENFDFKILHLEKIENHNDINDTKFSNFVILTDEKNKIKGIKNQIIIEKFPLEIKSIAEKINLTLLKQSFSIQSEINIKGYNLNLNSRQISKNNINLNLTERETDVIMNLYNAKEPQSINTLQKEVWGHNLDLETHTVETHIYRLRKKIAESFNDENFIISFDQGYSL